MINHFKDHHVIYTVSCKDGTQVASAAIITDYQVQEKLPGQASIFTAAFKAILLALKLIAHSPLLYFIASFLISSQA